jgi:hypothetical protein
MAKTQVTNIFGGLPPSQMANGSNQFAPRDRSANHSQVWGSPQGMAVVNFDDRGLVLSTEWVPAPSETLMERLLRWTSL